MLLHALFLVSPSPAGFAGSAGLLTVICKVSWIGVSCHGSSLHLSWRLYGNDSNRQPQRKISHLGKWRGYSIVINMIRFIAAIDSKRGLANSKGIPWQGKLPTDVTYFRQKTLGGIIMMGHGWYVEQKLPLPDRRNLVASSSLHEVRPGFELVDDARKYLEKTQADVWVGGGAALFTNTLDLADELYLTRIEADFHCTKFFPSFEQDFVLIEQSEQQTESGITFHFEIWKPKLN